MKVKVNNIVCIVLLSDYIHKASMCRKKVRSDRQFDNVDYTQLTETDNGFFDSQVSEEQYDLIQAQLEASYLLLCKIYQSICLSIPRFTINFSVCQKYFFLPVCKPTCEDSMESYHISGSSVCWRNHYAHYGKLDCERSH